MVDINPYAAPCSTHVGDEAAPLPIHVSGRWRRFFNWLIDKATIFLLGAIVGVVIALSGDAAVAWLEGLNRWEEYLLGLPIYVGYYLGMEGMFSTTLGKLCTGTRVVDERGHPIGFRQALLRSVCRLIPFDAFSLLMSDDEVRRAWHDSLARSYVVVRRAPPAEAAPTTF